MRSRTTSAITSPIANASAPTEQLDFPVPSGRDPDADGGLHLRRDESQGRSRRPDALDEREPLQPHQLRHGQVVATPLVLQEDEGTAKDFGFEQQHREQKNDLKSIGFNAGWAVTDRFSVNFDIHDSKARSLPDDPVTGGGETLASFAARVPSVCTPRGQPTTARIASCRRSSSTTACLWPNARSSRKRRCTAPASGGDSELCVSAFHAGQSVPARQLPGTGNRHHASAPRWRTQLRQRQAAVRHRDAVDGVEAARIERSDDARRLGRRIPGRDLRRIWSSHSASSASSRTSATGGVPTGGWKGNANAFAEWATAKYGVWRDATQTNGVLSYNPGFNQNHDVEEDTDAAYFQFGLKGDLGALPWNAILGVRYEHTDVKSTSLQLMPTGLLWQDNNDFSVTPGTQVHHPQRRYGLQPRAAESRLRSSLADNLKARFSLQQDDRARARYNDLRAALSIDGTQGSSINGFLPTAGRLQPRAGAARKSDNLDLSLEWYLRRRAATWPRACSRSGCRTSSALR